MGVASLSMSTAISWSVSTASGSGSGSGTARCAPTARAAVAYAVGTTAVVLGWVLAHVLRWVPQFPLDDPYITLHSAQVLHWGFDPNYPGVSALFGATSAPFLGLVYLLLFALPPLFASETACWLGVLAYTLGLVYLTRTLRLGRYESVAVVILGLGSSVVPVHLLNGLETSWALAGVVWTLALGSGEGRRPRLAALAGGMTAAIRPDLAPFTLLVLGAMAYEGWRRGEWAARGAALELAKWIGLAALPLVPFALWYLVQTGLPYPLTGVAKQYYFASGLLPWSLKLRPLREPLALYALSCGPLLLGLVGAWRSAMAKAVVGFAVMMAAIAYLRLPESLIWNMFRYPVVLVPMMVWGVAEWASRKREGDAGRLLITVCIVWCGLTIVPCGIRNYLETCRICNSGEHELVRWCQQNLPPDARLLVQDAGYVAYGSHFRVVDYVGLKTPGAIALNKELTWPSAGARRAEVVAALSRREDARYLVVHEQSAPTSDLPRALSAMGWQVEALKRGGFYHVYRLEAPEGR